jgi:protein SCO1
MKNLIALSIIILIAVSCGNGLPVEDDFKDINVNLVDHENRAFRFPDKPGDNLKIVGYIFTNCPDICPLTTNNMRLIQEKLIKEKITGVDFISISFDPAVDTPERLRKFTEVRSLNLSNWNFLTGEKKIVDSLMKRIGILAVVGDSTVFPNGKTIYYYVHTDRIQLIDEDNRVRKNYLGSKVNIDEVVADIKELL